MIIEAAPEIVEELLPEKRVVVDNERVQEVLGRLTCAFANNEFPYNQDSVRVPQDVRHLPETLERGSLDHVMLLWTACYYMRGGIKSVDAIKRLSTMYDHAPELFRAEYAQYCEPEEIAAQLKEHGLGFQGTISKLWVENARRMHERWQGDPRNIFLGVCSYEQAQPLLQNDNKGGGFVGFQEKMVSMITYFLMDEHMIDPFVFPLPVDIHVLRVSIANELLKFEGYGEEENLYSPAVLGILRKVYYEYARDHEVDPLRLCDAVWLLSQSSCGRQPGNVTLEPEGRQKRNGRQTKLVPLPLDLNDPAQQRAYERSCRHCPIEETCRWNVPGKRYYVQGGLSRRGERVKFPVTTLF